MKRLTLFLTIAAAFFQLCRAQNTGVDYLDTKYRYPNQKTRSSSDRHMLKKVVGFRQSLQDMYEELKGFKKELTDGFDHDDEVFHNQAQKIRKLMDTYEVVLAKKKLKALLKKNL